jgi:chromosomal replication initiation ATPase DnaA
MTSMSGIPPRVREIIQEVAEEHGFTPEDLVGHLSRKALCHARYDAWARIRERIVISGAPPSYHQIGRWFGGRDFSTIKNGLQRIGAIGCGPAELREAA